MCGLLVPNVFPSPIHFDDARRIVLAVFILKQYKKGMQMAELNQTFLDSLITSQSLAEVLAYAADKASEDPIEYSAERVTCYHVAATPEAVTIKPVKP